MIARLFSQSRTMNGQNNTTIDDGTQMTDNVSSHFGILLTTAHLLLGSGNILSNLLLVNTLYSIRNLKLRKTTRQFICYVSIYHSLMGLVILVRLFWRYCLLLALGGVFTGANTLSGMFFLSCEMLIMLRKPQTYQNIVTLYRSKVAMAATSTIWLGFTIVSFMTMDEPEDKKMCYMTNGMFHPVVLAVFSFLLLFIIIVTSIIQFFVVRKVRKVSPCATIVQVTPQAPFTTDSSGQMPSVPSAASCNTNQSRTTTRLHKLSKILSVSLTCYVVCWTPTVLSMLVNSASEVMDIKLLIDGQVMTRLSTLLILNGGLHVIIYLVMSTQIRQSMKEFFKALVCRKQQQIVDI